MTHNFAYGCCVASWEKFTRNVEPHTHDRLTYATSGHTDIVSAYNDILDSVYAYDVDGIILLHDDLEITDPHAEDKFHAALATPGVGIVGVAGGGDASIAWWEHEPIGHQVTDVTTIDFGQRTGEVGYLEGSILVLSQWAIKHLRFDADFMGFHGYEEICVRARLAGLKVVVADVDTHHHTQMGFKSQESAASWRAANEMYLGKWGTREA